jgi:hypothetical protein
LETKLFQSKPDLLKREKPRQRRKNNLQASRKKKTILQFQLKETI